MACDPTFTKDWFTDNLEHFRFCAKVVLSHDSALEIGCFEGRATLWLLETFGHVDAIDTFTGGGEHSGVDMAKVRERFIENTRHAGESLALHEGRSDDVLVNLLGLGRRYDFIYVDGSHASRDVIIDACLGWRMLAKGGVMLFDDYLWSRGATEMDNPRPAIDFFLSTHCDELDVLYRGWQVSVRKIK